MSVSVKVDYLYAANKKNDVSRKTKDESKVLGMDISHYSKTIQFLVCCIVVFACYITYGYLQELIFSAKAFKPCGWYLTLVQFGFYALFGVTELYFRGILHKRRIPLKTYLLLAVLTLGTMGFSNSSLGYLNYPSEVIFKCCKLIPVMFGSIIIQRKEYGFGDFFAAGLMCIGLTLFTLADSSVSPNFNLTGIFMISCALVCDGFIGNVQEKSLKKYKATNTEMVLYSYAIGFVYLIIILLLSGGLPEMIVTCSVNPERTYSLALLFSLSGYLGTQVVLTLVRSYGALTAVTVTTCRKAVTIAISFILFTKPFTMQYFWSGMIVVLAIYINILNKKQFQKEKIIKFFKGKLSLKPKTTVHI